MGICLVRFMISLSQWCEAADLWRRLFNGLSIPWQTPSVQLHHMRCVQSCQLIEFEPYLIRENTLAGINKDDFCVCWRMFSLAPSVGQRFYCRSKEKKCILTVFCVRCELYFGCCDVQPPAWTGSSMLDHCKWCHCSRSLSPQEWHQPSVYWLLTVRPSSPWHAAH